MQQSAAPALDFVTHIMYRASAFVSVVASRVVSGGWCLITAPGYCPGLRTR
jgi:hypothetical protein